MWPPASRTALSGSVRLPVLVLVLALAAGVVPAAAQSLVTSAATVRLRAEPSTSSGVLAELPLGTELVAESPVAEDEWRRVRTADGETGWVAATFLRSFSRADRLDVFGDIVRARLRREGDAPPAWFELVRFVERVETEVHEPETAAAWAYLRLLALRQAGRSVDDAVYPLSHPYRDHMDRWEPLVVPASMAGTYILNGPAVVELHDRHRGTTVADDMLWLVVEAGINGECEGYIPCYINVALRLEGVYLRDYPAGRHAAEAVQRLAAGARRWSGEPYEVPASDCPELLTAIATLRKLVAGTAVLTEDAVSGLNRVAARCGG